MSTRTASLDMWLIEPQTGRVLSAWEPCVVTSQDGLRIFNQRLGAALANAQDAVVKARGAVATATVSMNEVLGSIDTLLAQNPDPTTPNSTKKLMDAIGGQTPTTDRAVVEERLGTLYGLTVVNGMLFPKGGTDISGLRNLFQTSRLDQTCDLSELDNLFTSDNFIFVACVNRTTSTVIGTSCGQDVVEYTVSEYPVGTNISIEQAAKKAGVSVGEVLIRFCWLGTVRSDRATLMRLKALGIEGDDLAAVVTAPQVTNRVTSYVLDTSILGKLRQNLDDSEICTLLSRRSSGVAASTSDRLNVDPTPDDITKTINDLRNMHSGQPVEKGKDAIADGVAGRAGDPLLMAFGVVDLPRCFGFGRKSRNPVRKSRNPVRKSRNPGQKAVEEEQLDERCTSINLALGNAIDALSAAALAGSDCILEMFGNLGFGTHSIQAGLGFSNCLVSLNLGLSLSLSLGIKIPFQMQAFMAAYGAAMAAITAATASIKALICIPQGLIDLLFGGICGFKPFDFDLCAPDLMHTIERVRGLISLVTGLIASILMSLQFMRTDIDGSITDALNLKLLSTCAAATTPLGIALGLLASSVVAALAEPADLAGDLSGAVSVASTFGGGQTGTFTGSTGSTG